jgi:hypothetical protein
MTKITLEVGDLFSVLGAHGIERQLQHVAGVGRVSVNPVSGSTTVMFEPASLQYRQRLRIAAFIVRAKPCPGIFAKSPRCRNLVRKF